ncbi:MAG: alpha/beta hydrolase [Chloroflexota bacterium]|mgnify:CR=1 FL=1
MLRKPVMAAVVVAGIFLATTFVTLAQEQPGQEGGEVAMTNAPVQTGYASVNGLEMYYEIYGQGEPLVALHGAYMNIPLMGDLISRLAESRQVIAVELQGHGRTADIDRPLRYEHMADDVAALMGEIGVERADIFGYSMGGGVALQMALRHPERVDKLVVASATFTSAGYQPGFQEMLDSMTPEMFEGSPVVDLYRQLSPHPDNFATLFDKLVDLDRQTFDWPAGSITAPTLLVFGDADVVTPENAVELFRMLGGGVNGDIAGLPNARLAILPGTTHLGVMMNRTNLLVPIITEFLDEPVAEAQP